MKIRKLLNMRIKGFSLLEVLVSLFVFSIGMLGLAGMQITSMKNSTSAHMRTTAMILANDIADKMRANVVAAGNYIYTGGAYPPQDTNCETTAGCTPTAMADNDVFNWLTDVGNSLPNASAQICRDNDPEVPNPGQALPNIACTGNATDPMVVYIDWNDNKDDGGTAADKRFVMTF